MGYIDGAGQLSWKTRVKIAMGVAQGLSFLHTTNKQVMCRFFQTANILLNEVQKVIRFE